MVIIIGFLQSFNELLTAGIAITAFSLLLYALSFNLRDRVARTFAIILACVVIVFVGEAFAGVAGTAQWVEIWLKFQWVGIIFLPPVYLHFSDALLATTGKPSRGRRRNLIKVAYSISVIFALTLAFSRLVGPLVDAPPAPHLERTTLTWIFAAFYLTAMIWAWVNFGRAYRRTVTSTSRRRMAYLIIGALAPALGSYPYLLFGSGFAIQFPLLFWTAAVISNILVSVFLVVMAYAAAFFGVPWPDRVVKRRLFKWLMRGPVTASTVLAVSTLVRRWGASWFGTEYSAAVPVSVVATMILMQYSITLLAPVWERWLFYGGDRDHLQLLQTLEDRLLSRGDLRQFLEAVLTAVCDRLQVNTAFVATLGAQGLDLMVTVGDEKHLPEENLSSDLLQMVRKNGNAETSSDLHLFSWGDFWIVPLYEQDSEEDAAILGLLGTTQNPNQPPDDEQREALSALSYRAAIAIEDRYRQEQVFSSLESLTPQVEMIQQLRAAARYDGSVVLTTPDSELGLKQTELSKWVKDALSHYWGGPKLTKSPLLRLQVVQQALDEHDGVSTNALRAILRQGIERTRPDGERRFTAEWILYNILEMKFMEGRKVREIALRLAMSEADLYRKQRVAIKAVAHAIVEMETQAREEVLPNAK